MLDASQPPPSALTRSTAAFKRRPRIRGALIVVRRRLHHDDIQIIDDAGAVLIERHDDGLARRRDRFVLNTRLIFSVLNRHLIVSPVDPGVKSGARGW